MKIAAHLHRTDAGFTLTEMMVAIAVLAILASVAVPSFRSYTANQTIRSASFDVTTDLMLARSEAVKRNTTVTVAPAGDGWSDGWTVTAGGDTLRATAALKSNITIEDGAPDSIVFDSTGRVVANGIVQVGLNVEVGSVTQSRCISLDPSGMPKVVKEACG